jgi:hypothetical protein
MKGSAQAGLVLAVGYALGRRRKLRTATLMAAAAATGGAGSLGAAAFRRGLNMLGSSDALGDLGPQLSEIAETVRGDLAEAGKAAVLASVTNRISSLSESLQDRVAAGNPAAGAADAAGQAEDSVRDQGRPARRGPGLQEREPDDREPEDEYQDEGDDLDDEYQGEDDAPPVRRRAARSSPVSRTRR